MRRRRRRLAGGLAAGIAIAAFLVVLTVTNSLGRSTTTRAAVQVGAPTPRFTG